MTRKRNYIISTSTIKRNTNQEQTHICTSILNELLHGKRSKFNYIYNYFKCYNDVKAAKGI